MMSNHTSKIQVHLITLKGVPIGIANTPQTMLYLRVNPDAKAEALWDPRDTED